MRREMTHPALEDDGEDGARDEEVGHSDDRVRIGQQEGHHGRPLHACTNIGPTDGEGERRGFFRGEGGLTCANSEDHEHKEQEERGWHCRTEHVAPLWTARAEIAGALWGGE
jgi:hypothetical protein